MIKYHHLKTEMVRLGRPVHSSMVVLSSCLNPVVLVFVEPLAVAKWFVSVDFAPQVRHLDMETWFVPMHYLELDKSRLWLEDQALDCYDNTQPNQLSVAKKKWSQTNFQISFKALLCWSIGIATISNEINKDEFTYANHVFYFNDVASWKIGRWNRRNFNIHSDNLILIDVTAARILFDYRYSLVFLTCAVCIYKIGYLLK